ncbi:MAG: type II toxin-antitoxin system RelE/ParE family toxin [Bacteroidia bacterium]
MSYPFDFHPKVEKELFEAIGYLDAQREGYGALLADETANTIEQIANHPTLFPLISDSKTRRRALLGKPFHKSYSIYFEFDGNQILILCFFNNWKDPRAWQERE